MESHPYSRVGHALAGTRFARIRYTEVTASTNEDAAALLGEDRVLGTTIIAEHQTQGAGRKGRSWIAHPGTSLLFTTILPSDLAAADLWSVPFWVALCVRDALAQHGLQCTLHWPNDLLLDGRKVAGILCVSRVSGTRARVGCGVGINVHRTPGAEVTIIPEPAFCDDVAPLDRAELLQTILTLFDARVDWLDAPQNIARRWEREAGIPGQCYRLLRDGDDHPFDALAVALETGGSLIVERENGHRESVALADARALR